MTAATDSFRLGECRERVKNLKQFEPFLIPARNVAEIIRVFSEEQSDIAIHITPNQVAFATDQSYVTSRLIDGIFPDYRQIIPKEFNIEAIVLKQDLLNALRLSNIFSDKFNQINLLIKSKEKIFELSSQNNDIGENKTYIDAVIKGGDVLLSFNYKYFLDCFQSINTDSISIKLNGSSKPIIISGSFDNSFTYLIMPMNK